MNLHTIGIVLTLASVKYGATIDGVNHIGSRTLVHSLSIVIPCAPIKAYCSALSYDLPDQVGRSLTFKKILPRGTKTLKRRAELCLLGKRNASTR